ncbi:MAG: SpaA isopeptide-forming pilin-related protein, partial [Acutalibacteraceae bacterium]
VGTYCWAKDTTSSINISATFKASTGDLTIIKTSANTELTVNNPCYSLYGAEFKLVSKTDSSKSYTIKTTTKVAGTENYKGTIKNIPIGKYILKEISVPSKSGYSIPKEWKTGKEITISVGDNSVTCSNEPTNDPVTILVTKTGSNGEALAGAEFTIKYYKGYFTEKEIKSGEADSSFKRYWTLKTDNYGFAGLSSEYLIDSNNDFYYATDSGNPCLPLGTITIQETKAPDGYVKDDTLYVRQITSSTNSVDGVITFNPPTIPNYEKQGYLQIKKTSEDGIVANIDMEIYEGDKVSADKLVGVYTTDSNGLINEKFNIGKYTIKEIVNEDRYHEQEPQTITVTENNTEGNPAKVSFHNTLKDGWLRLVKTSEAINGTRVVAGVKFTIYKGTDENGTLIGSYVTEASTDRNGNPVGLIYEGKYTDGEGNINLSAGTYTIIETKMPQYKKAQSQTITILPNRETSVSFHNVSEEKDYTLTIKKKSAQRGYINEVIEPFKFVVKGNSNDFYREVYLYPHQETVIDIPSVGSYQVYEELTDNQKQYWAEPEQGSQTVLFNNAKNEHKEVTFTNVELTGNLELTKTATDGHIKGAKFVLYGYSYSGRFIVATASTDENGKLSLTGIPYGEYSFYEANAGVGANGETNYYPSLYKHNGKVVINGKSNGTVNITVNNKTGRKVRLVKTSDDGLIEGFEFKVTNVTTGKVVYESIKTNENGELITSDLAEGRYKFEEILSKDSPYKKQEPQYVDVKFPTTQEEYETPYEVFFANTYEKAEVTLKKISEDGVVKGVRFDVVGVNYRSEEINKTLTTNADGTFTVKLDEGTYTFKEIYVPYMLNGVEVNGLDYIYNKPEPQTITVKAKETVEIKFNNTLATGTGNLTKVTYDNMFEGIEFTLSGISDAGKKVNISKTIEPSAEYDELGRRLGKLEFINIPVGTYDLKETKAPAKYLTPEVIKVTIKKDETTYVEVENPAKPQTVKIKKTSENGVVEGVVLDIDCDELGYHKTITLNSTGEMLLELVPATYTVTEMYVPFMLNGVEVNGLEYIYEPQEAKTIVVEPYEGQDRNYTVQFNNTLRKGDLTIQKIADDNEVMGVKFNVTGTSMSGEVIDITGVTDTLSEDGKSAKVIIKDIPIGVYTIKEIDAPDRYITTEQQELTIEWNIDKTIAFNNRLSGVISTTAKDK